MTVLCRNVQLTTQWRDGVFQIVEDSDYNGPHHTRDCGYLDEGFMEAASEIAANHWLNLKTTAASYNIAFWENN